MQKKREQKRFGLIMDKKATHNSGLAPLRL